MAGAVKKYLEQWAEPEVALADAIEGRYERALVVPAFREDPALLGKYLVAADTSHGRTLCILVVNAPAAPGDEPGATPSSDADERFLHGVLAALRRIRQVSTSPSAWFGSLQSGSLSVLVIDRATGGARLPAKEGVGLARKIGCDVALALHDAGKITSRFIFGTDADTTLPEAWFDQPALDDYLGVAAVVMQIWHEPARDGTVTHATALYELGLRYHVAGLAWAGSPYAFHTLGSATVVAAEAYAAVRGYPRRAAAEDFYLLNKIAKVGSVVCPPGSRVRIESRISHRTPFGTGASVAEYLEDPERKFPSPLCFSLLREVLVRLDAFTEHADLARLLAAVETVEHPARAAAVRTFEDEDARAALDAAAREAPDVSQRRLRVATWFDAFRTLKLLHAARDAAAPPAPFRAALADAPFAPAVDPGADAGLVAVRTAFALAEARFPMFRGPWSGGWGGGGGQGRGRGRAHGSQPGPGSGERVAVREDLPPRTL